MMARDILAVALVAAWTAASVAHADVAELAKCEPMPAIIHAEQPRYPERESRVAINGSVTLQFTIKSDGSVTHPKVVANDPVDAADWFDAPALEAIVRFMFKPVAAPCVGTLRITFNIVQSASAR